MNCRPKPQTTCGTLLNDTCVVYTGPKFCFLNQEEDCYRQNEFNEAAGALLCDISGRVDTIESDIDLSDLLGCSALQAKATVKEAIQELYTVVCDIKTDLDIPIVGLTIPDCITNPCSPTPFTLGTLLEAIMAKVCDCCTPPLT